MIKFTTVIRGKVLSGTDRTRSEATGRYLTAACHQQRLAAIHRELRSHRHYGRGERCVIRDIEYRALFDARWLVEVDIQVVLGARHKNQLPDIDNLWRDFQNAMAFPDPALRVPMPTDGAPLYTVVVNDRQFTAFSVRRVPDPVTSGEQDLVIARFTALPPPALDLALAH